MFLKKIPFVFMLYPVSNTITGSSSVHDLASNTAVYPSINPTADIPEPMVRISTPAMIPKMTTTPLWLRRWTSQCSSHVPTIQQRQRQVQREGLGRWEWRYCRQTTLARRRW